MEKSVEESLTSGTVKHDKTFAKVCVSVAAARGRDRAPRTHGARSFVFSSIYSVHMLSLALLPTSYGLAPASTSRPLTALAHSRYARAENVLMQVSDYDQETYNPEKAGLNVQPITSSRPDGTHGTGFRFMPLETVSSESAPAVVCIAGVYPGLTAAELAAPQPVPFAAPGGWNYHMLTGDAAPGGFVALPGSHLLDTHPDSVAVVCTSPSLGLEFPDGQEHEVIALIDRADTATFDASDFDPQRFYAVADPEGNISIRWYDALPAGHTVVGRLLFTQMPYVR